MAGHGQKEDELDGSINCKPLIDGLLMKKAVSQKQKQVVYSVERESAPAPGLSALNRGAGWNELLLMAVPDVLIGPRFLLPWMLKTRWLPPQLG